MISLRAVAPNGNCLESTSDVAASGSDGCGALAVGSGFIISGAIDVEG